MSANLSSGRGSDIVLNEVPIALDARWRAQCGVQGLGCGAAVNRGTRDTSGIMLRKGLLKLFAGGIPGSPNTVPPAFITPWPLVSIIDGKFDRRGSS